MSPHPVAGPGPRWSTQDIYKVQSPQDLARWFVDVDAHSFPMRACHAHFRWSVGKPVFSGSLAAYDTYGKAVCHDVVAHVLRCDPQHVLRCLMYRLEHLELENPSHSADKLVLLHGLVIYSHVVQPISFWTPDRVTEYSTLLARFARG